jgi:hypothetical protein
VDGRRPCTHKFQGAAHVLLIAAIVLSSLLSDPVLAEDKPAAGKLAYRGKRTSPPYFFGTLRMYSLMKARICGVA